MTGGPSRYDHGQNTRWDLVALSTHDDRYIGRFPITHQQLIRVRELFDYDDDEWFADSYPVRPELWPQVIEILSCPPPEQDRETSWKGPPWIADAVTLHRPTTGATTPQAKESARAITPGD